ncbi:MAG: hypothetical protein QF926_00555 [Alphaproteobacteria bacterium]|nr:hypothetical protein [Alphaproteobacteria bacterium]MDP6515100.1 hypothetical protein [Alphaproteobacteria bacterium]
MFIVCSFVSIVAGARLARPLADSGFDTGLAATLATGFAPAGPPPISAGLDPLVLSLPVFVLILRHLFASPPAPATPAADPDMLQCNIREYSGTPPFVKEIVQRTIEYLCIAANRGRAALGAVEQKMSNGPRIVAESGRRAISTRRISPRIGCPTGSRRLSQAERRAKSYPVDQVALIYISFTGQSETLQPDPRQVIE